MHERVRLGESESTTPNSLAGAGSICILKGISTALYIIHYPLDMFMCKIWNVGLRHPFCRKKSRKHEENSCLVAVSRVCTTVQWRDLKI